ncbi:hypothetical protein ZHAS_00012576 [Anopheles sinensis]|uniref:Uncharacterized protein n=1 Tax=Anopheles sinensis TaxID=74873 RepID=A0A084W395_ANOSI|nr:hypothetical protein ZHAS_00012576 [Anopheles sinensis]
MSSKFQHQLELAINFSPYKNAEAPSTTLVSNKSSLLAPEIMPLEILKRSGRRAK